MPPAIYKGADNCYTKAVVPAAFFYTAGCTAAEAIKDLIDLIGNLLPFSVLLYSIGFVVTVVITIANGNSIKITITNNLHNVSESTINNTHEESSPGTKSITLELLNTDKVVFHKTQSDSHTKNDLQETAKRKLISFAKNNVAKYTISHNSRTKNDSQDKGNVKEKLVSSSKNNESKHSKTRNPHTKNDSPDRLDSSTGKYENNRNQTDSRRFNTVFAALDVNDPSFQSLLNDYRDLVHKYDKPGNVGSQKLPELVNPLRDMSSDRSGYLTPTFIASTPYHLAISYAALIKGRVPAWGKKISRDYVADRAPDPNLMVIGERTQRRTLPPLPPGMDPAAYVRITLPPPEDVTEKGPSATTRSTLPTTTSRVTRTRKRTTPVRHSFTDDCDYIAYYCMKAYETGLICGRTMYNQYRTFKNYCLMDFVNCKERYDVWQIMHMGECYDLKILDDYIHYPYIDDYFLDQYYVIEMDNNG